MSEQYSKNEKGLLDSVSYSYSDNGLIDWRSMIDQKYLIANESSFPEGTDMSAQDVSQLEDSHLLVLLAGLKELASIRGYAKIDYETITADKDYAAVKCTIIWTPNYETGMKAVQFSALADANASNTSGYGRKFLMAVCENRAFARAVRNFLRINIVCQDELDPNEDDVLFEMI